MNFVKVELNKSIDVHFNIICSFDFHLIRADVVRRVGSYLIRALQLSVSTLCDLFNLQANTDIQVLSSRALFQPAANRLKVQEMVLKNIYFSPIGLAE